MSPPLAVNRLKYPWPAEAAAYKWQNIRAVKEEETNATTRRTEIGKGMGGIDHPRTFQDSRLAVFRLNISQAPNSHVHLNSAIKRETQVKKNDAFYSSIGGG